MLGVAGSLRVRTLVLYLHTFTYVLLLNIPMIYDDDGVDDDDDDDDAYEN